MPTTDLQRRRLLVGAALGGVSLALPRAVLAAATDAAQALVTSISADLTALVNSGKSEAQLYVEFERLLARYADMQAVAAATLGPPWRMASPAEKKAYVAAFQTYLSRKYGRQFNDFRDAQIRVTGARDGGKAGVLVNTEVVRPGRETIAVDWQISDRSGATKAVNLIIEGVSMLANERAEVGAMYDAGGGTIDGLIAKMQART